MATESVLVITVGAQVPNTVADDNAELAGQAILDYVAANPSLPEFQVNVKRGVRTTPDV